MKKTKNILIISAVFPPEPLVSSMMSADIASSLAVYHNVTVLCPIPSRPEGYQFDNKDVVSNRPYKVEYLKSYVCPKSQILGRFRESVSFGKHCVKFIEENKKEIDIIYVNSWPLFSQKMIVKCAKYHKINCILHIQDVYPESLAKKLPLFLNKVVMSLFKPMDRYSLLNSSHILGNSKPMIDYLSKTRKINIEKFTLIRNWQNDEKFLNLKLTSIKENSEFTFMYVGSIAPTSGIDNVIKAYNDVSSQKTKLVIAGNGSFRDECLKLKEQLKNDTIEFKSVTPEQVPFMQSQADILILPLKKGIAMTATPSKLTAYLFSGKPVIACVEEKSDVANIIKEGKCGFVVEPENIEQLSKTMQKIYDLNSNDLQIMGVGARNYAIDNLSKNVNLDKLKNLIDNLVKEK